MTDIPFFSVVVPLYNKRSYIRRTVESVLSQDFRDFELIVVDDGSTDGSADAFVDIADNRLRVHRQLNRGVGAARNTGMELARGEWIALLDADDAWLPSHLRELARVARTHPEAGFISTGCVETSTEQLPAVRPSGRSRIRKMDYFLEASRNIGIINSTSVAVRKAAFLQVGGFGSEKAGEDLEYWARLALAFPIAASDLVTCLYFRDTGGAMADLNERNVGARLLPPMQLRDLSASVSLLCTRAERNPSLWQNTSIVAYVNSRITSGIKGALFRGDVQYARALVPMLLRPMATRTRLYALAARTPATLTRLGVSTWHGAKKLRA